MRVLVVVISALVGAVAGIVLTVSIGLPLAYKLGANNPNGGVEMGVIFGFGPVGAVIGAIFAIIVAVKLTRDKPQQKAD